MNTYRVTCQIRPFHNNVPVVAVITLGEHKIPEVGDPIVVAGHGTYVIDQIEGVLPDTVPWRNKRGPGTISVNEFGVELLDVVLVLRERPLMSAKIQF